MKLSPKESFIKNQLSALVFGCIGVLLGFAIYGFAIYGNDLEYYNILEILSIIVGFLALGFAGIFVSDFIIPLFTCWGYFLDKKDYYELLKNDILESYNYDVFFNTRSNRGCKFVNLYY